MSLAKNIQFLRKKHGLTQDDLSEYLCVSRQSISKWETGEAYPETEKIIALCDKFNVSMDLLVRGDLTSENQTLKDKENNISKDSLNDNDKNFENKNPEDSDKNSDDSPQDIEDEAVISKNKRIERIKDAVCGLIMIFSIVVFLIVGLVTNIWHPTWIALFCGAILCAVIGIVFDLKKGKKNYSKIMGGCCGILMSLTAFAYVIMNLFIEKWHPSWIMFLIAALLCGVLGIVGELLDKKAEE